MGGGRTGGTLKRDIHRCSIPRYFSSLAKKKKVSVYTILRYIRGFNFRVSYFVGAVEEAIFTTQRKDLMFFFWSDERSQFWLGRKLESFTYREIEVSCVREDLLVVC